MDTHNVPKVLPLGLIRITTEEGDFIVPDPHKADLVVLAFQMASKGKSFRTILKTVTEQGLTSSRGNPLSLSSLHNMLTNILYTQYLWHGKNPGTNMPLVSKTLFELVQKNLKRRRC
jgi:hypothetical protein